MFEGLKPTEGEKPIASLGVGKGPDKNWISKPDGTLVHVPREECPEGDQ